MATAASNRKKVSPRNSLKKAPTTSEGPIPRNEGESDESYKSRVNDYLAHQEAEQASKKAAEAAEELRKAEDAKMVAQHQAAATAQQAKRDAEEAAKKDLVDAVIPKRFQLTLDTHETVVYHPGTQPMPRKHAEHPWAKAHGVKIYEPVAK